ncbi:hypothetical protein DL89DRAFT_267062, partial [Linderina pennispora]
MIPTVLSNYIPTINGVKEWMPNGDDPFLSEVIDEKQSKAVPKRWHWPFAIGIMTAEAVAICARNTAWFMILYGILSGLLWAHRAYKASYPLELFLAVFGASSIQGSIIWWVQNHRLHHRYTDTERDPYNIKRGFWYAHHGWIIFRRKESELGYAEMSDLYANKIVNWQYNYYFYICGMTSLVLPTCICGYFFNDWVGGFLLGRLSPASSASSRSPSAVNSVAHTFGTQPYSDEQTPRDNFLTGIITLGEGYHNFHHAFPNDYRNGVRWYDVDLTKWILWVCEQLGLAKDLKRFPRNEIMKGRATMKLKNAEKFAKKIDYGKPIDELPMFTESEFRGKRWIVIEGFIYNLIKSGIGKDMTHGIQRR